MTGVSDLGRRRSLAAPGPPVLLALLLLVPAARPGRVRSTTVEPRPPVPPFVEHFDALPLGEAWSANAHDLSRIQIVSSPVRATSGAIKLTVHPGDVAVPGDRKRGKGRAEVNVTYGRNPRTDGWRDAWYAWSLLVPSDYPDELSNPRFQIMGQFHAVPDLERGEDWGSEPGTSPPMISIRYGYDAGGTGLGLFYGLKTRGSSERMVARKYVTKGTWIDLTLHVGWSRGPDGFVEAYLDGEPWTPWNGRDHRHHGPNLYNEMPPMLKLGLYRDGGFERIASVVFDELRIGHSRDEVRARGTAPAAPR